MKYHKLLPWLKALCNHDPGFYPIGEIKTALFFHPEDGPMRYYGITNIVIYQCSFCSKFQIFGLFKRKVRCLRHDNVVELVHTRNGYVWKTWEELDHESTE